jgi:dTDP-glucose pyrophosphorylase
MNIVITMAGNGSRFFNAGYKVPKFEIDAKGKTLFEWSMLSLIGFNDKSNKYIFICRKDHNAKNFIAEKCEKLNIKNYVIKEIDFLTDGQATTALLAENFWNEADELLIYNIDTFVEPFSMKSEDLKGEGFIPCFEGQGDHWSFVKLDNADKAVEVAEKKRISKYCTLGAYYFKSAKLYKNLYEKYYSNSENLTNGERYIAPLYNQLIKEGGKVYISNISIDKIHALGTPDELNLFLQSDYKYEGND